MAEQRDRVTRAEVVELLRRVGSGEAEPRLVDAAWPWWRVYAGNVEYMVDGWRIEIFNDCDSWDYVDRVVAPDGREGEYEDWAAPLDAEIDGVSTFFDIDQEFGCLYADLYDRMANAFINCRLAVDSARAEDQPPEVQGPPSPLMSAAANAYVLTSGAFSIVRLVTLAAVETCRAMVAAGSQDYIAAYDHTMEVVDLTEQLNRISKWLNAIKEAGEREDP